MVVRFDLKDSVGRFLDFFVMRTKAVFGRRTRIKTVDLRAFEDGSVVGIGNDGAAGCRLVRFTDHAKQGLFLFDAVNRELGIEDLVAAVLGVGLREHHQFNVRGIALLLGKSVNEIVNFVGSQRKAHFDVGRFQRFLAARKNVNGAHFAALNVGKEHGRIGVGRKHRLGHAIVQQSRNGSLINVALDRKRIEHAALDAGHRIDARVMHDVGCLGRPGADGAQTRHNQELKIAGLFICRIPIIKKRGQTLRFIFGQISRDMHKVQIAAGNGLHGRTHAAQLLEETLGAKFGQRARAGNAKNGDL